MSRLWRERVHISLAPHGVSLARLARGWKRRVTDYKSVACEGKGWQPGLDVLREMLSHPNVGAADATVVLSIHFVRHLVLPWDPALTGEDEMAAYARARFVQVYGEGAKDWELRVSRAGVGAAQIAVAVERSLLDAIDAAFAACALRLVSVQPRLMTVLNGSRATVARDAWISIAEPGRLLLGLLQGGHWLSLRTRPLDADTVVLRDTLEQESLLLGLEHRENTAFVLQDGGVRFDAQGVDMRPLRGLDATMAGAPA